MPWNLASATKPMISRKITSARSILGIRSEDLADPHWFVVVALPSQAFMIGGCLKEVVARAGF